MKLNYCTDIRNPDHFEFEDEPASGPFPFSIVACLAFCCCLIHVPTPTATAPAACAAPEARMAPPAPPAMAGMAGMLPTVMRMALRVDMTFGWSVVRRSSALQALRSQDGTSAMFVTANNWVSQT